MSFFCDRERLRRYRLNRTQAVMKQLNVDALVATTLDNFRYISDCRPYFTVSYAVNSYVAVLTKAGKLAVQGPVMEGTPMGLAPQVEGWKGYPMIPIPAIPRNWTSMVGTMLREQGVESGRVGFDDMSFISYLELSKAMSRIQVVPAFDAMLEARMIKSQDEIALLRKAEHIVDLGAEVGLKAIKPGVSERELVSKMSATMYEAGSEAEPWATSLSSGERSLSSLFASDRVLKDGDLAVFDLGSIYEGYMGDIARTGAAGTPSHEARVIYTAAYDALSAGINAVRPGKLSSEIDGAIRKTLTSAGCEVSPLSTGHGIGVGSPELPWITPREEGILDVELKAGMVICLELRTSKDNLTAAGCEDMVLVTDSGYEVLTKCPKQEHLLTK
ncbi:MAG: Xaa-Pro peptidase family protein [Candidatus Bathyarchaeia archaeon]